MLMNMGMSLIIRKFNPSPSRNEFKLKAALLERAQSNVTWSQALNDGGGRITVHPLDWEFQIL